MNKKQSNTTSQLAVGINIQMQDGRKIARYIQTGIMREKGFTGLITDYCGGGQYQDFYFQDGKEIPDDDMDMGTIEHTLEEAAPGIIDAIYALRDKYLTIDEENWIYYANEELLGILPSIPEEEIFSAGDDITPVTCSSGMTTFPDSPEYEHFGMLDSR